MRIDWTDLTFTVKTVNAKIEICNIDDKILDIYRLVCIDELMVTLRYFLLPKRAWIFTGPLERGLVHIKYWQHKNKTTLWLFFKIILGTRN